MVEWGFYVCHGRCKGGLNFMLNVKGKEELLRGRGCTIVESGAYDVNHNCICGKRYMLAKFCW